MYRSLQPTEIASSEEETANKVEFVKFQRPGFRAVGKVE